MLRAGTGLDAPTTSRTRWSTSSLHPSREWLARTVVFLSVLRDLGTISGSAVMRWSAAAAAFVRRRSSVLSSIGPSSATEMSTSRSGGAFGGRYAGGRQADKWR